MFFKKDHSFPCRELSWSSSHVEQARMTGFCKAKGPLEAMKSMVIKQNGTIGDFRDPPVTWHPTPFRFCFFQFTLSCTKYHR